MTLTPHASDILEFNRRYGIILSHFNVNENERRVCAALLLEERERWSFSGIAAFVEVPRPTVRRCIEDLETMGLAEITEDGVGLSDRGRNLLTEAVNEGVDIAMGDRRGFASGLLARFRELPQRGVRRPFTAPPELETISWPRLANLSALFA